MGSGKEAPAPLMERAALATKNAAKPNAIRRIAAIRFIRHLHTKIFEFALGIEVCIIRVTGLLQRLHSFLIYGEGGDEEGVNTCAANDLWVREEDAEGSSKKEGAAR